MRSEVVRKLKVSIWSITYNHELFIKDCLEGILKQETKFDFELIIGDDASIDGTSDILRDYAARYPEIIKPIIQKKNVGAYVNSFESVYNKLVGEYIAICEGDDYWEDPLKLQKQVDFLEANPQFSICFSPAKIVDKEGNLIEISNESTPSVTTFKDLLKGNYLNTPTVMLRKKSLPDPLPEWIKDMPMFDWPLLLHASMNGDIKMLNEPLAAYRIHDTGVWSTHTSFQKLLVGFKSRRISLKYLPQRARHILLDSLIGNALYISSQYKEEGNKMAWLKHYFLYLYFRVLKLQIRK
jgi:glycosyltransferase involved in cell wall biosynthesis